ncbi:MAG: two component transcriptional regulator, winged helix family [Chloroflexi bacterium]|nr:two component transcriptional regulator, winged helix family [Chloroflexota bacterium]
MQPVSAKGTCIAIADDDPKMIRLLRRNLELQGYRVVSATDGPSAIELVETEEPALLVLDVVMPGMDGCEVLTRLREFTWLPVIILSGKDDEHDIVRGLEAGADDYVTKPFAPRELLARVQSALRRASFGSEDRHSAVMSNGEIEIDYAQHLVKLAGNEVLLTPTEYRLLACLAQNVGRTLTQEDILLRVWGNGYQDEAHLLRVNVARLRGKLGETATVTRYVVTRPGVGYTMPRADGHGVIAKDP